MKLIIDISETDYGRLKNGRLAVGTMRKMLLDGTPLEDIRSKILYEIYMDGVNMANEYHGCWVRFKNIETIVNRYMRERSEDDEGKSESNT